MAEPAQRCMGGHVEVAADDTAIAVAEETGVAEIAKAV